MTNNFYIDQTPDTRDLEGTSDNATFYSKAQVLVITLIGLPIAGAILIGKNAKTMGEHQAVHKIHAIGILVTIACLSLIFLIFSLVGIWIWYDKKQKTAFDTHIAKGGKQGTWGATIGIGICSLFIILLISIILIYAVVMMGCWAWSVGDG